jgi:hypothetical protein
VTRSDVDGGESDGKVLIIKGGDEVLWELRKKFVATMRYVWVESYGYTAGCSLSRVKIVMTKKRITWDFA